MASAILKKYFLTRHVFCVKQKEWLFSFFASHFGSILHIFVLDEMLALNRALVEDGATDYDSFFGSKSFVRKPERGDGLVCVHMWNCIFLYITTMNQDVKRN